MINIIQVEKGALIGGLEWFPIDSVESAPSEVKEIIKRRKTSLDDDSTLSADGAFPLLSSKYAVCNTLQGICAVGIVSLDGAKKISKRTKRATSIAALCTQFARDRKTPDAIFGFAPGDDELNLVGIRNGLPVYDAVLSRAAFKVELPALLSMFEMGCTVFGDEALFLPPVIPVSLSDLAGLMEIGGEYGRIKTSGTPMLVQAAVFLSVISLISGYFVWDEQEKARKKEAELAALATQNQAPTPAEVFAKAQADGLLSIKGCQSIDVPFEKMIKLHHIINGYRVSDVTADCQTGAITASYRSPSPADLTVRLNESRIKLNESLVSASIKEFFLPQPVHVSVNKLLPWQDWLVNAGTHKQKINSVGVHMNFGAASPGFGLPPDSVKDVPVIIKGKLSIDGPAQFMLDAVKLIDGAVWQTLSISNDNGYLTFNVTGDYYAIKD